MSYNLSFIAMASLILLSLVFPHLDLCIISIMSNKIRFHNGQTYFQKNQGWSILIRFFLYSIQLGQDILSQECHQFLHRFQFLTVLLEQVIWIHWVAPRTEKIFTHLPNYARTFLNISGALSAEIINSLGSPMKKHKFDQFYQECFEHHDHSNTTIERIRRQIGRTISRNCFIFDSVEDAQEFFTNECGIWTIIKIILFIAMY